jgi:DNA-binding NarL/FixJ family response regulator
MDINLPRLSGIQCLRELKRCLPQMQFIMLTIEDDSDRVFESLQAGATGYLVKNVTSDKILAAIEEVHRGGSPMSSQIARILVQSFQRNEPAAEGAGKLSPRENEILTLLTRGYRSKEAADELGISVQTVNTHLRNIYEKLHVRSRSEAVARYLGR